MKRIWGADAHVTPPASSEAASEGYPTDGSASGGYDATTPGAYWFHQVTEEIIALIVGAGLTPNKDNLAQVLAAVRAIAGLGKLPDTDASHYLQLVAGSNLTADRILSLVTGDAARTLTLSGNPTLADWFNQNVKSSATPTFQGVTFPNGQTLSTYEVGTWTPVIGGSGGTSGQGAYTTQAGRYIRKGRDVTACCQITLNGKGSISGYVQIQGLPFPIESIGLGPALLVGAWGQVANGSGGVTWLGGVGVANTSAAYVHCTRGAGDDSVSALMTTADIEDNTTIVATLNYCTP